MLDFETNQDPTPLPTKTLSKPQSRQELDTKEEQSQTQILEEKIKEKKVPTKLAKLM